MKTIINGVEVELTADMTPVERFNAISRAHGGVQAPQPGQSTAADLPTSMRRFLETPGTVDQTAIFLAKNEERLAAGLSPLNSRGEPIQAPSSTGPRLERTPANLSAPIPVSQKASDPDDFFGS